ncbi:histidine phosphatase family protein [Pseudomonadota bacterium]
MKTTVIVARHGNTFDKGETPLRVGLRTDLPLSISGRKQAKLLGKYFKQNKIKFDVMFTSELKRTYETGNIALEESGQRKVPLHKMKVFNEIDYGPDEGKTEEEVIARIGQEALNEWDKSAKVPEGWKFNLSERIIELKKFFDYLEKDQAGKTILIVTSNGIARFLPYLTKSFDEFAKNHKIKISTSAFCVLEKESDNRFWTIREWNSKPKDLVKEEI